MTYAKLQHPTRERLRELFDYDPDQGLLIRKGKNFQKRIGLSDPQKYRKTKIDSINYRHNRLVWIWHNGDPGQMLVDHINRDRQDDHIENLRLATESENHRSSGMYGNNTSGYKGVTFEDRVSPWRATIYLNGKRKHLGRFATKEEATAAYQKAAAEMHGEFAGAFS